MENKTNPLYFVIAVAMGMLLVLLINKGEQKPKVLNVNGSSKFDEVMYYIEDNYVDTVDLNKMETDAIVAMIDELDPHSNYISVEEFNEVNDPLLGSFEGIGVQFRLEKDTITVVQVIKAALRRKSASWLATASSMLTTPSWQVKS